MTIKTVVSDNLLISGTELTTTTKNDEDTFVNTLTQTKKGILEPVSTVDGKTFFYTSTSNVKANGDAINDTYIAYASNIAEKAKVHETPGDDSSPLVDDPYFNNFSENYGVSRAVANTLYTGENKALGYIDYVFQLKAINTSDSTQYINLTKLDLTYAGAADASKAYRVAVFAEEYTTAFSDDAGTKTAIYTESGAHTFNYATESEEQAIKQTTTPFFDEVEYADSAVTVASVAKGTKYYKVVVRLWLEGEDTTCNNETFMVLTDEWALDLELKLENTEAGVTNINKTVTPTEP